MAINAAGQFFRRVWPRLPLSGLMRSLDVYNTRLKFRCHLTGSLPYTKTSLCRHVRRNVVFNRSTCDDEDCTLVDNVLTKRLVTTLAINRAGRIFVYFAMEHCVRLIRETVAQQYRRPNATFCPSPQRPNAFSLAAIRLMALLVALHW